MTPPFLHGDETPPYLYCSETPEQPPVHADTRRCRDIDPEVLGRHTPLIALDMSWIIGCTCGWLTPSGTPDSDNTFSTHVALQAALFVHEET
jgi:hypothetical protein